MSLFDRFNHWIQNTEVSFANTVSFVSPWLAPLIPMYIAYQHMTKYLDFPLEIAIPSALVVEFLGFSTISTTIMFWNHNRKYTTKKNQVPFLVPAISFLFYLGIILSVNVLLELNQSINAKVLAKGLLTSLSIPAAVTIGVRAMYRDVKEGLKRKPKNLPKVTGNLPQVSTDYRKLTHDDIMRVALMDNASVQSEFGTTRRTASNWIKKANAYADQYVFQENK